ncbi:uncharacterized protein LOC123507747 isoform X1 [Portunus trituberculatus]|uniref:uncharacterized protein LOC123507747 isoform X1 n=2 Tax=Portunus trituberculatus TaxID=210409 RepID=UPI001E1CB097|nr:uncharacterized protein LOC123507747 isoform X1 [Portunus trituberculatus]
MFGGLRQIASCTRWAAGPLQRQTRTRCGWRSLHTANTLSQRQVSKPSTGSVKVWYIPNPFKWLHNRMEIAALQKEWDSSFNLETFKLGAAQAICTVSDLMSQREWGELRGLLTQKAIDNLRATKWTFDQTHNLTLCPENVQTIVIKDVKLQSIVDQKYCDIDVLLIGAREPYSVEKHSLVVLEYFARFHRNYSEGRLPEWTITVFKLQSFQAAPQRTQT